MLRIMGVPALAAAITAGAVMVAGAGDASAQPVSVPASHAQCFRVTAWSFDSGGPAQPRTISSCVPAGTTTVPAVRLAAGSAAAYPTVGRLFYQSTASGRVRTGSCTGTVLNGTKAKNSELLVLTAAHCVKVAIGGVAHTDYGDMFVPGWAAGKDPYGEWSVRRALVDSSWITCSKAKFCAQDPVYDFAILVLSPKNGIGVGTAVGAADGWEVAAPDTIPGSWIFGYPSTHPRLLLSRTTARTVMEDGTAYRVATTPDFTAGTSGGPWFSSYDPTTGTGVIYGDVGGFEEGGDHPTPSYSAFWKLSFAAVVAAAVRYEG
jgi:V8-like Glu-specific endopeptidase